MLRCRCAASVIVVAADAVYFCCFFIPVETHKTKCVLQKNRCAHSFSMFTVFVVAVLVFLLFFRAMHVEYIAQIIMFAVAVFFFCRLLLHLHTHTSAYAHKYIGVVSFAAFSAVYDVLLV